MSTGHPESNNQDGSFRHPVTSELPLSGGQPGAQTGAEDTETRTMPLSHTKAPDEGWPSGHTISSAAGYNAGAAEHRGVETGTVPDPAVLLARQKERFGGMKFGSAFFGWLTATGLAVILTALVAGVGAVVGLSTATSIDEAANQAARNPEGVAITGAVVILAVLLVSYYAGGYVAGRMARFSGGKQGFAVWLWAILTAVVTALLGLMFGARFDTLGSLNSLPRVPLDEGQLTGGGIIAVVAVLATALLGAVLGGLAGMHYHRKIDRASYDDGI